MVGLHGLLNITGRLAFVGAFAGPILPVVHVTWPTPMSGRGIWPIRFRYPAPRSESHVDRHRKDPRDLSADR